MNPNARVRTIGVFSQIEVLFNARSDEAPAAANIARDIAPWHRLMRPKLDSQPLHAGSCGALEEGVSWLALRLKYQHNVVQPYRATDVGRLDSRVSRCRVAGACHSTTAPISKSPTKIASRRCPALSVITGWAERGCVA